MTAVALVSGGLDSTVAATLAHRSQRLAALVTADYGQRAARREIAAAALIARALGVAAHVIDLRFLATFTRTALIDRSQSLALLERGQLDDVTGAAAASMRAVWVPNRNGVLINAAAAIAESLGADAVVVGFNVEEAATFPDNTLQFAERASAALALSTLNQVRVEAPTAGLDKIAIVRAGYANAAPMHALWSCYGDGATHCFACESCLRLERALRGAGCFDRFVAEWEGRA